jgi:hypothetical protein
VEEGVLDVQLMNQPRAGQSQCENNSNGGWLDNWTKTLLIVNPRPLSKASKNLPSLVAIKRAVRQKLVMIDPFTGDDVHTRWTGNQSPSVIGQERINQPAWPPTSEGRPRRSGMSSARERGSPYEGSSDQLAERSRTCLESACYGH